MSTDALAVHLFNNAVIPGQGFATQIPSLDVLHPDDAAYWRSIARAAQAVTA